MTLPGSNPLCAMSIPAQATHQIAVRLRPAKAETGTAISFLWLRILLPDLPWCNVNPDKRRVISSGGSYQPSTCRETCPVLLSRQPAA
jgi:hypothetical protein